MSAAETVLGKLAGATSVLLQTHGWQKTIETLRGEPNVADSVSTLLHKASRILEYLRTRGAPVLTSTPPWTQQKERDRAIDRGPHKSSHGERDFVVAEMLEFCEQGYWLFVPYHNVCDLSGLRISPLGVVPQRDRRPQLIVDYTFSNVNQETVPLAPREAIQFGRALYRVIHNIVGANPRYGPVYMSKIDISDGFYRIWVAISDIPKLDVALPVAPGQTPLVTFPLALPMGWIESPPFFTSTVTDYRIQSIAAPSTALNRQQPHSRSTWRLRLRHSPARSGPTPTTVNAPWLTSIFMSTISSSRRRLSASAIVFCEQPCIPLTKFSAH